jgi:hypothetical protein
MSARYTGGLVYNAPGGWSGQFNGTSSYLSLPYSANYVPGTGDFTAECWVMFSDISTNARRLFALGYGANGSGPVTSTWELRYLGSEGSNQLVFYRYDGSTETSYTTSGFSPTNNTWYHVAVSRTGGSLRIFVNGVALYSAANSFNYTAINTSDPFLVALAYYGPQSGYNGPRYFPGYISNIRFIKGTGIYSSNFTPPTTALSAIANTQLLICQSPTFVDNSSNAATITNNAANISTANPFPTSQLPNPALGGAGNGVYTMSQYAALKAANLWPAYDPYYKNVTLNLHGNAGTVLPFNTDASTNNFQVTQVGNTSPSNYTPFIANGYWSNYFDGTDDFLSYASTTTLNFGTADFTVECWINLGNTTSSKVLVGGTASNAFGFRYGTQYLSNNGLSIYRAGVADLENCSFSFVANTWYHVAVVRQSNVIKFFVNGTQQTTAGSGGASYSFPTETNVRIGTSDIGVEDYIGNISNLRVTKSAVYTSNFTPSTTPLTAITNTSLLTCQSNRFIDNSTNAFTITQNGNVAVNPLQPFTAPTGTSAYGSGYFDGSGDYLTVTGSALDASTTTDYTVEFWMYTAKTGSAQMIYELGTGATNDLQIYVSTTALVFQVDGNSPTATVSFTDNSWVHVACVKAGGTLTTYINGVGTTVDTGVTVTSKTTAYIGMRAGSSLPFAGYLSNMRVNRSAVYTSNFTPPTSPLTAITNTSLLTVQTNAPSQNNTFLDSSTNNFVITRNGNTTQGTFTPYGSNWSGYFGGAGSYMTTPSGSASTIVGTINSSLNLCIECWVYLNEYSGSSSFPALIGNMDPTAESDDWSFGPVSTGALMFYWYDTGQKRVSTTSSIPLNTWTHVAVNISTGVITLFINGVSQTLTGTTTLTTGTVGRNYLTLGQWNNGVSGSYGLFKGYVSNLRVIKASTYTANFTPSTAPLTAVANTSLLMFQSNRFIDNSANAFAITVTGSPSVQRFSPFTSTYYQPSVIGGSGYFDGTGDYLSTPSNSAFSFGSGNFTVECWAYMNGAAQQFFIGQWNSPNRSWVLLVKNSGTTLSFTYSTTGSNEIQVDGSIAAQAGRWAHFAAVRNGNTLTTYMNGVSVASASFSGVTLYSSSQAIEIGRNPEATSTWNFSGYMTDVRVVKGTAIYTTAFTPPTAALTAVSGTSLLCNYTNAAIFDNAMMNDLETVGNAQISTSVKKYGTGSMYFDGTGDWLSVPDSQNFNFGSGNFTIEFWIYLNSVSGTIGILGKRTNEANYAPFIMIVTSSALKVYMSINGSLWAVNGLSTSTLSTSTWYNIAVTRSGSTVYMFLNGTSVGSTGTLSGALMTNTSPLYIGADSGSPSGSSTLNGYIDDLRITKGVARYTGNFTPPTSQVQDQ